MGLAEWFSFKSREEKEREAREYERWAFPYGQAQKAKIAAIIKELLPEEPATAAMAVYLMGREGYRGSVKEDPAAFAEKPEEVKLTRVLARIQVMLPGRKKAKLSSRYVALIIADTGVDERLEYPTVAQLREKAQQLEPILEKIRV